jgi:mitochondrial fission protein ELM1
MKPHIPTRCFDLCLIPRHDSPRTHRRIIVTEGVLNDIGARTSVSTDGLVLIGGPSAHYGWDDAALIAQIRSVVAAAPAKKWIIADSRRTPPDTTAALQGLAADNLTVVPFREVGSGWLTQQLAHCDSVWVSRDSVSMIYEALTAGAAVGVLEVPAKRADRITGIVPDLAQRGMITQYADWHAGTLPRPGAALAEATRCAKIILERWDPSTRRLRVEAEP